MNRPVDLLIHHMRGFARSGSAFEAGFAKSILKQARRPDWRPSRKQIAVMDAMVSDLFDENVIIEEEE